MRILQSMGVWRLALVGALLLLLVGFAAATAVYAHNSHNYDVTISGFIQESPSGATGKHQGTRITAGSGTIETINSTALLVTEHAAHAVLCVPANPPTFDLSSDFDYRSFHYDTDKKGNNERIIFFEEIVGVVDEDPPKHKDECYDLFRIVVEGDLSDPDGRTITTFNHFGCDSSRARNDQCHNEYFSFDSNVDSDFKVDIAIVEP